MIAVEFAEYFASDRPSTLSTHRLPALETVDSCERKDLDLLNPPAIRKTTVTGAPFTLRPLFRHVYSRWIRAIPWFAGQPNSREYLAIFDRHVDEDFKPFFLSWLRATKFDILGFAKHYYAIFLFAYTPPGSAPHATRVSCSPVENPQTLQEFLDSVLSKLASTNTFTKPSRFTTVPVSSTSTHAAHLSLPSPEDIFVRDRMQEMRYKTLSVALVDFMDSLKNVLKRFHPRQDANESHADRLFEMCKPAPTVSDLPDEVRDCIGRFCRAVAVLFENILDDDGWRSKARKVWAKIPITVIVTALRVVNPAPFVDTLLRIFVWKPPGGLHSLLQLLAAVICSMSATQAELRKLRENITPDVRTKIEEIISSLWQNEVTSCPEDEQKVILALSQAGLRVNPTYRDTEDADGANAHTRYARQLLREREKIMFVDAVGSDGFAGLIVHIVKFVPPVLRELWGAVHMAEVVQAFFDAIGNMLGIVGEFDDVAQDKEEDAPTSKSNGELPSVSSSPSLRSYAGSVFRGVRGAGHYLYRAASFSSVPSAPQATSMSSPGRQDHQRPPNPIAKPTMMNGEIRVNENPKATGSVAPTPKMSEERYHKTIKALSHEMFKFIQVFYPAFYVLANKPANSSMLSMHALVDWLLREFSSLPKTATDDRDVPYISAADASVRVCRVFEQSNLGGSLSQESSCGLQGLIKSGVEELKWCKLPLLEGGILETVGVDIFREEILRMIGRRGFDS
ncbi:hypothetical protein HDU82_000009 [Entophlyctis luteolus]|nr:hypothetical protein HDU82_000009 [Entophlyctis luteolus]